jgi:HAD superfamily hydrolase (TIGR01509 family)
MAALIFDLDGTLVDTVYAHVFAWQRVLGEAGLEIDAWRIHRRVGISGSLFTRAAASDLGRELSAEQQEDLRARHLATYAELLPRRRPLPGALELLRTLRERRVPFGIATSGKPEEIGPSLECLGLSPENAVIVGGHETGEGKPAPDPFLRCRERLGVPADQCYVIGDAVWDLLAARRARMLGVGLLSGGYGEDELTRAGAYRVYRDAAELNRSLDELGVTP